MAEKIKPTKSVANESVRRRNYSTTNHTLNAAASGNRSHRRANHVTHIEGMSEAVYTDEWNRSFAVLIQAGEDPSVGQIIGPLPLDGLGLDHDMMVRLHNEMFHRKLLTYSDVLNRPHDVQAAIQAACKLDIQTIQSLYATMGT